MYDKSIKIKNAKVAREMQEELAFDMKVLQKLLEETHNEALEEAQRKVRVVTSLLVIGSAPFAMSCVLRVCDFGHEYVYFS